MENNALRYGRASQPFSANSSKQRRSGYEPSDTETDWQESPLCDQNNSSIVGPPNPKMDLDLRRNISPMRHNGNFSSKFYDSSPKRDSMASPVRRRNTSKSPYRTRKEDGRPISPASVRRNVGPFSKSEHRRQVSPFKSGREEHDMCNNDQIIGSSIRKNRKTPNTEERGSFSKFGEVSRMSERSAHSHRSVTAPRTKAKEKDQENDHGHREQKGERTPSPLPRSMTSKQREREASHRNTPSVGELNEMVADIKMSRSAMLSASNFESTESISPGDIFFSRENTALMRQKNGLPKNGNNGAILIPRPTRFPQMDPALQQLSTTNDNIEHNLPRSLMSSGSRSTMISSSAASGQSSGKFSTESSKISDTSRTSMSWKKFAASRKKSQSSVWFSCMRGGPCRTSRSPEKQHFDEDLFIEKAFVVESLREFWADKHQPCSLNGFTCHKQEAQLLKQLVSLGNIPHILLKGPSGAGKRSLAMALLYEIFGDACRNISHDLRYFQVQEKREMQVAVPATYSVHHVELNVNLEPNAKYALMGIVKEISNTYAIVPEVSKVNFKPDYRVLVLYQVDKATENIQHLIKWIMDCYTDACKVILCCEDDVDIPESVKNRCKVIEVDAPVTHEIMEVLIQIARKEDFDLPMNFAARIAAKSKQNLRKAIMALEACKAHNYPFADDQPIPFGWEEVLVELATEILTDPSPKRLFSVRGKLQKLLLDFVHPELILLNLVGQFLKGVEASSRRELYYWHGYYDKRLPTGTSALLKLEEFVAKFMSIHRKSSSNCQYE
ncbi:hypothetical protein P3X46_029266 [Hevea brasiliensis]|uniref:Replication factor C C-terminal domain-containing protein n=1 Tax=Hevea brasiliensis TaxID=3981 RepID=A0ABQ9KUS0_HEVBR|nr:uncharacterized protein LOC110645361 [Hevea brasiliensis]XP_057993809.1 uncharacterized protein LOC110645361 [Hevea brasiliensis]KAJ9147063.1 hypothetical protein P3X46_029266 [Hevea brasiliensis]